MSKELVKAGLRQLFRVPPLRQLKSTVLLPAGKGRWLFSRDVLAWAFEDEVRRQLPRPFRTFVTFCSKQSHVWSPMLGGQRLFEAMSALYQMSYGDEPLRVEVGGRVIFLDARDPAMLQVPNDALGEGRVGRTISEQLRSGDTFIDIGANHGAFSIHAAHIVGSDGQVIAFEPQPRLAPLVQASLAASPVGDFVVHQLACGDEEGTISLYTPLASSGSAGIFAEFSADERHRATEVRMKRLDDVIGDLQPEGAVFVKLDVEGAEFHVLRGGEQFIRRVRPRLLMEANPDSLAAARFSPQQFTDWIADCGYTRFRAVGGSDGDRPIDELENLLTTKTDTHYDVLLTAFEDDA